MPELPEVETIKDAGAGLRPPGGGGYRSQSGSS